jgi:dTDP-4-amino-4,6-dideoxygalactose transaminase
MHPGRALSLYGPNELDVVAESAFCCDHIKGVTAMRIPFNKPCIVGQELSYVAQAIALGNIGADGVFTQKCSRLLERRLGIHKVLLVPSCTAALEIAAMLLDIGPGDEVILPSFTFVSTANAFVRLGAKPVFVDVRPDTLNIDDAMIEDAITRHTRAICPVHYAGVGCDMDRIMTIARRYGISVIEDAAQGVNAFYNGRALGSIGRLGCFSFHETKNYICGEGGALCINDPELVERAEIIRHKGTNRKQFLRGEVDKYTWVDLGSNYALSELSSAFLYAQLEMLDEISERRRAIHEYYRLRLEPLAADDLLRLLEVPDECQTNYHLSGILLRDRRTRDALMSHLKERGILAVFHYIPLHSSPMGQRFGYRPGDLPVTEEMSGRLLRLPAYYTLTESDQSEVMAAIREFLCHTDASVSVNVPIYEHF